jgi:hypothetical protein
MTSWYKETWGIEEHRNSDKDVPHGIELVGFELDTQRANDGIMISPHLFEANGKLLMVKRDQYQYVTSRGYNRKVEIFEADIGASMWTLVLEVCRGLGALFCE